MLRTTGVLFLIVVAWSMTACNPTKQLSEGSYLLHKNSIQTNRPELRESLNPILKQKPNRRVLGFRFHLSVYTLFNRGKENKFKSWVKRTIGEAPVILDTVQTLRSAEQLDQYLNNLGYFNAEVSDTTVYRKNRKAVVSYRIRTGEPYTIRNIDYDISDRSIDLIVRRDSVQRIIERGANFDSKAFRDERERVVTLLGNYGYYGFGQQFIFYNVDSTLGSNQVDVEMVIRNPFPEEPSVRHKRYRLKDIYIRTDYDPLSLEEVVPNDTMQNNGYNFLYNGDKPRFKPKAILPRLFLEDGKTYRINDVNRTYRGLTGFGVFRFVNIRFEPSEGDSAGMSWLDSYISLTPVPKQDYKVELEGTHNGGNFGIGGNISYRNKNMFRGIEQFEVKMKALVETLPNFVDTADVTTRPLSLNTYEFGPEINFRIPRMLWPLQIFNRSKLNNPFSLFSLLYNFQSRPEFERNIVILSTGLEYSETKYKKHFIYPAEINFADVDLTPSFIQKIIETNDPLVALYYRDYLITNGRYSFVFNNQDPKIRRDFIYFRFNFEIAGNSLRAIDKLTRSEYSADTTYKVLGTPYSQYFRPDVELRYYNNFSPASVLVYRLAGGFGYAYLNSEFLPYEKVFYAGGANELRAFSARKVGPGSYVDQDNFEQFGDIKINGNIEYRFDIIKKLKGAFFLDAGNVWLRDEATNRPGGELKLGDFLSEVAVGTGIGIRFDFTFFIFRVDGGIPVRDPSRKESDRWVIDNTKFSSVVYNFGIGYPF